MPDPTQVPAPPPPFESLPLAGTVELDRFCEGCGYNLMQQAVRRETNTQLLLCRCPECGQYNPANTLTTAHRAWFRGLVVLGWCVWIVAWLNLIFFATLLLAALPPDAAWQRRMIDEKILTTRHVGGRHYGGYRTVSLGPMDQEMWLITGILFSSFVLAAAFLTTLTAAFMPHWKRWGYVVFAAGWPAIALGLLLALFLPEQLDRQYSYNDDISPAMSAWLYRYSISCVLITAITGIAFAWLGRPLARLLVRIFVPPRRRGPFAYLWLVDEKSPPPIPGAFTRSSDTPGSAAGSSAP